MIRGCNIRSLSFTHLRLLGDPGNVAGLGTPTVGIIQCGRCPAKANRITFVAWGKEISSHWKDTDEKVARAEIYFQMLGKITAFICSQQNRC